MQKTDKLLMLRKSLTGFLGQKIRKTTQMVDCPSATRELLNRTLFIFFLVFGFIVLPFEVFGQRFLFGDGSFHLLGLLRSHDFIRWDFQRQFALYILHSPIVFGLKVLELKNIQILTYLYGCALVYIPFLCVVLSMFIARRLDDSFVLFPLLCYSYLSLNNSFFIVSESHLAAGIFWISFFTLMTLTVRTSISLAVCAAILSLIMLRLYEATAIYGPVLALLCLQGIFFQFKSKKTFACTILILTFACITIGAATNFYWVIWGISSKRHLTPAKDLLTLVSNFNFILSTTLTLLAAISIFLFKNRHKSKLSNRQLTYLGIGVGGIFGSLPLFFSSSQFFPIETQYPARYLNFIMPTFFAVLLMAHRHFNRVKLELATLRPLLFGTICLLVWTSIWNTGGTAQWIKYKSCYLETLKREKGFVRLTDTPLTNYPFNWEWTSPTMSIVLGSMESNTIQTIITNPRRTAWQPFKPPQKLPDLTSYGINYSLTESLPKEDFSKTP
jgi:hypothetical protein